MGNTRICCVDDNLDNLNLLYKALTPNYDVYLVDAPEMAMDRIANIRPHLVLMDVNMPVDGYKICKEIRTHDQLGKTPVIFVSCLKELEDRLKGYEVGCDGYICKPYDLRELKMMVHSQLTRQLRAEESVQELNSIRDLSYTMLRSNSEMGQLLQFSRGIAKVKDEADFVDNLFSTLNAFGLNSTLLVKLVSGEVLARNDGKPFTQLERELLDLAAKSDRISSHGTKYLFTSPSLSILIKNMPIDDTDLAGRLRDHICILLESAEAGIGLINSEKRRRMDQAERSKLALKTVQDEFGILAKMSDSLYQNSSEAVERLASQLENAFMFMQLNEEQEGQILAFIEATRTDIEQQYELKTRFKESMQHILDSVALVTEH